MTGTSKKVKLARSHNRLAGAKPRLRQEKPRNQPSGKSKGGSQRMQGQLSSLSPCLAPPVRAALEAVFIATHDRPMNREERAIFFNCLELS